MSSPYIGPDLEHQDSPSDSLDWGNGFEFTRLLRWTASIALIIFIAINVICFFDAPCSSSKRNISVLGTNISLDSPERICEGTKEDKLFFFFSSNADNIGNTNMLIQCDPTFIECNPQQFTLTYPYKETVEITINQFPSDGIVVNTTIEESNTSSIKTKITSDSIPSLCKINNTIHAKVATFISFISMIYSFRQQISNIYKEAIAIAKGSL